ncbi:DUF5916 domain-containing protein [soil metagenome]
MLALFTAAALFIAPFQATTEVSDTIRSGSRAGALTGSTAMRAITIQRAAGPIRVDGDLGDEGWEGAARATGFVEFQPRENVAPPVQTEVLLTYDDSHLYLAFIAQDHEPSQIRATLQQRDQIWNDDFIGLIVDPHGNASLGYFFFANPLGVQGDMQATPQGEDPSIDFIYQTSGRITEEGYVVEMAIPFSSLRFPNTPVQSWKISLIRNYPRSSRHMMSWVPFSQNNPCMLCQLGTLEGIEGIRAGGTMEILPAIVASQAGRLQNSSDPGSFQSGRVTAEPSLNMKYIFRNGWMTEAALNPDFSQVESDAAQVDVNTTFALFYPERRPFFQEGMDLFETRMNVFYSRSINAPQGAAKLTGRNGQTSIGYIGARDEHTPYILPFEERSAVVQAGRSFTNVVRLRHGLDGGSHIGGLFTDRRLDGSGSGTTASADAMIRFGEIYRFAAHVVGSYTREPDDPQLSTGMPNITFGDGEDSYTAAFDGESYAGYASSFQLARNARSWSWNVNYSDASPTYRADAGFQARNNFRRTTGWTGLTFFPHRYGVERISPSLGGGLSWNFDGARKESWLNPGISATLPRQTNLGVNTTFREETFRGVELTGVRRYSLWLNSNFSDPVSVGFNLGTGRTVARMLAVPEVGEGTDASVWATIKPVHRVVIEPSLTYAELSRMGGEQLYSGYIARTRFNYQHNRELQLRMVVQYNDFAERLDLEPLIVYQLNPFTIFYVGSTYGSQQFDQVGYIGTDRQYFAKFQYLFRR